MVLIIRSLLSTDFNRGFKKIYDEDINEQIFENILKKYKISYVLFETRFKKIYSVILANNISIEKKDIICYSIYYNATKERNYKILINYIKKDRQKLEIV